MKAASLALLTAIFVAGSTGVGLAYRHFHHPPLPYLAEAVQRMDIESTVTTLGHIAESRDMVEAAVSEADIFKLHPGQRVIFNLVAVPDSRFEGTVREIKAMPIAASIPTPPAAADSNKTAANDPDADAQSTDDPAGDSGGPPVDPARAMAQPSKKRDIYSSGNQGVFYTVVFDMGDTAGRYPAGMSVMTHVVLGVATQTPAISIAALGKPVDENRYEVETMDARGHIVTRQITTGLSDTLSIEVKSGLQVGDKVVIRNDGSLYAPGYKG